MKLALPLLIASIGMFFYAANADQTARLSDVNFDRDVRPILSQHCFKCHGPDAATAAGGLRLDSLTEAAKSEGIIVPGAPEKSYLIKRVSAAEMPPPDSGMKPLTPAQVAILTQWIKQGARYEKHWSYIAPTMPNLPPVTHAEWCKNPIDRFVLAKLDAAGLKPEPEAERDTLALRAAQTLTGLPPTTAELVAFRRDRKPGAYERFVDRLLAKPAYGEHEARYWLDAVRYGDTHGLQLDNERGVFPYRDWVVRAYNQDLSFDKFVEWQLAGYLLPKPTTEQLIATGYVRMNLTTNEGGAIADEFLARNTFDRVDTTSTVMLGLTIQCAKCHDHKYDPIKQSDYYGLYAFFNSTKDAPLDGNITLPPPFIRAATPEDEGRLSALSADLARLQKAVNPAQAAAYFEQNREPVPTTRDWQISRTYSYSSFDEAFDKSEAGEPGQTGDPGWKPFPFELGKDFPGLIGKDSASVYVRGTIHLDRVGSLAFGISSDDSVRAWLNGKLIHSHKIGRGLGMGVDEVKADLKAGDNELVIKIINMVGPDGLNVRIGGENSKRIAESLASYRKDPRQAEQLCALYLELGPTSKESTLYRKKSKERADFESALPMSLIAEEMPTPRPTFILKRGQYDQKGEPVTRHTPSILGGLPAGVRADRLAFARWLTAKSNPLLARVFVNRVWQQHLGIGIVKTVDDFGSQGEWPLNQPLLDYLAVQFEQSGWSVKKLNRMIVTSAAFRQSSRITPAKLAKDPENRLVSRGPRFRLDAEVIRDKALYSGGLLVEKLGGHGFKPYQPDGIWEGASDPASSTHIYQRDKDASIYRRSLYLFWKRTAPPPAMLTFDAPLRDTCVVRRSTTNTPLQALTTENETSFLEASRTMAQRLLAVKGDDRVRLNRAFDLAFARPPRPLEVSLLEKALATYRKKYRVDLAAAKKLVSIGDAAAADQFSLSDRAAWMIICSTLINTDEFLTQH